MTRQTMIDREEAEAEAPAPTRPATFPNRRGARAPNRAPATRPTGSTTK